jgi:stage V sporulation protein R
MKVLDPKIKRTMERCKRVARDAGLNFDDDTLEYVVSNQDMIKLSPKIMIPTLYDYWVHDVEVLKGKGIYKARPHNPYETVINTRPAISFYNVDNPDWLNTMIFYHVLGHIDFFQNNRSFANTWDDDFCGKSLANKRLIENLRGEHGRWVDYTIEFARNMDNLVNYSGALGEINNPKEISLPPRLHFYFNKFMKELKLSPKGVSEELNRYRAIEKRFPKEVENLFLEKVVKEHPGFGRAFNDFKTKEKNPADLMEFVMGNSPFLNIKNNAWMKDVIEVVRETSLYFQPQIRTKIFNEGWATYWHTELFKKDPALRSHQIDFAIMQSGVASLSRVGLNPYAVGWRMVKYAKERADRGLDTKEFKQLIKDQDRQAFDLKTGNGTDKIFELRHVLDDYNLIDSLVDQDFVNKHNLFVVGRRANYERRTWQYFVQSRNAEDYKQMLLDQLYHPPHITYSVSGNNKLLLKHEFDGKQLVESQIANTMKGISYLWDGEVRLETTRLVRESEGGPVVNIPHYYITRGREVLKRPIGNGEWKRIA